MSEDARDNDPGERPAAAGGPARASLAVVSFRPALHPPEAAAELRLLREYKGPTVAALMQAESDGVIRLPGRVCRLPSAIERADLGRGAHRPEGGVVLAGPGAARRRAARRPWRVLLALWLLGTAAAVAVIAWR